MLPGCLDQSGPYGLIPILSPWSVAHGQSKVSPWSDQGQFIVSLWSVLGQYMVSIWSHLGLYNVSLHLAYGQSMVSLWCGIKVRGVYLS